MRPVADLAAAVRDIQDLIKKLPTWAGREAVNFYKDSWRRQGYINNKVEKWAARKSEGKWGKSPKKGKKKSRAILVQSGDLRRSIRFQVSGNKIHVWTDVPYAQVHNEGLQVTGTQTVPSHTRRAHVRKGKAVKATTVKTHTKKMDFKMPKRQFMDVPGQHISPFLEKRFIHHIARALEKFKK
jgi:phage gpG-like protein